MLGITYEVDVVISSQLQAARRTRLVCVQCNVFILRRKAGGSARMARTRDHPVIQQVSRAIERARLSCKAQIDLRWHVSLCRFCH